MFRVNALLFVLQMPDRFEKRKPAHSSNNLNLPLNLDGSTYPHLDIKAHSPETAKNACFCAIRSTTQSHTASLVAITDGISFAALGYLRAKTSSHRQAGVVPDGKKERSKGI